MMLPAGRSASGNRGESPDGFTLFFSHERLGDGRAPVRRDLPKPIHLA